MCHCLDCQKRSGSVFAAQARWPSDQVEVSGRFDEWTRVSDDGTETRLFHFCPECGSTVFYTGSEQPGLVAVPIGAFADPSFPPPRISVYERRRHPWVAVPAETRRD
jgi:hypothetical protein